MDELKQKVVEWAESVGVNQAIGRLISRDVGVHTAARLCKGQYDSVPRGMLANILKDEIQKDGPVIRSSKGKAV